jgi:hypothetical protein
MGRPVERSIASPARGLRDRSYDREREFDD